MNGRELTSEELTGTRPGEAVSIAATMAILVVAIVAVIAYKLMRSQTGGAKIPGGWAFSWK